MAFTLIYNSNGSTSGSVPTDSNSYNAGDQPIILDNTGSLLKTDYSFVGWSFNIDGSGLVYTSGMSFVIEENTTLYAVWTYNYIAKSLTTYKLSPSLKIDNLWIDFMWAIAQELQIQKQQILSTRNAKNIYEMLEDDLINYAQGFGYTPNLVVNNSREFTLQEIESIPFRIRNKTTYNGYIFGFKRLGVTGDVFNLYYDGFKLVKAINWVVVFDNLQVFSDHSLPFNGVVPIKNFSVINTTTIVQLDTGRTLDEPTPWLLDQNLITIPVKHLAVEYFLDHLQTDGTLINPSYMIYYQNEIDYNRRVSVYPHAGVQLTILTNDTGYYDQKTAGMSYTIPDIQLDVASTLNYYIFKSQSYDMSTLPFYMTVGTGKRNLLAQSSGLAGILNSIVVGLSLDEPYGSEVYNTTKVGSIATFGKVNGLGKYNQKTFNIFGYTLNFDGTVYVPSDNDITSNFLAGQTAYQFWLNANAGASNQVPIFDHGQLIVAYDYANQNLLVSTYVSSTLATQTVSCSKDQVHYVYIEIDSSTSIKVYIDGVLTSLTLSTAFTLDNQLLIIGNSSHYSGNFTGMLEQFVVFSGANPILSSTQINYIFQNKISLLINSASQPTYRSVLQPGEINKYVTGTFAVSTTMLGNSITDEFIFTQTDTNTTFNNTLRHKNIVPKTLQLNVYGINSGSTFSVQVRDDGGGKLLPKQIDGITGNYIQGQIDYATGGWSISFTNTFSVFNALYNTTTTSFSQSIISAPTQTVLGIVSNPSPIINYYTTAGVYRTVTGGSDSAGGVNFTPDTGTGGYITSGSLSSAGVLTLSFTTVPGNTNTPGGLGAIFIQYQYTISVNSSAGTYATMDYSTSDQLQVTEMVVEDINKKALFYSSFPVIQVQDFTNNISPVLIDIPV